MKKMTIQFHQRRQRAFAVPLCFRKWTVVPLTANLLGLYLLSAFGWGISAFAQAPMQAKLAFASNRDGNGEIYLMDVDGSHPVNLTRHPVEDWSPAWSPDGKTIAFVSSRGISKSDIYLMDADGKNVRKLFRHFDFGVNLDPAWSPDGKQIVFSHQGAGGGFLDIYVVNADGNNPRPITQTPEVEEWRPDWSPDGRKIAFVSLHGLPFIREAIDVFDFDTKQTLRLIADRFNTSPAWSPDGSQIAFARDDGIGNIYVMNRDGSNLVKLTDGPGAKRAPDWSPDGQHIVYEWVVWNEEKKDLDYEIFVIDADGSNLRQLTHKAGLDVQADWFDLAALAVAWQNKLVTTWGRLKQATGEERK